MNTATSSLGRSAVVGGTVLFALTLLAGVVGGMWRLALAGSATHVVEQPTHGAGFVLGFGLPLAEVLVLAAAFALPVAAGYFVYDYATCGPCRRTHR
jgi:hypothetical protein